MNNILKETSEIKNIEADFSSMKLLCLLRHADPEYRNPKTISYLSLLSERSFRLLRVSCDYLLGGNCISDIEPNEIKLLHKLAAGEGMLPVARVASSRINNDDFIRLVRRYILMRNVWEKITDELSNKCDGASLVPLIPTEMLSLYREPWLRCGNSLAFFADIDLVASIKKAMADHGFVPDKPDPLEADRLRYISFRSEDDIVFQFFFDLPLSLYGACGDYVTSLFQDLAEEGREMSLAEYALLLAVKLHMPNIHQASACLCDLLDLSIVINAFPDLTKEPEFREKASRLIPAESLDVILSICRKVLPAADDAMLQDIERQYLIELIGRPYLRAAVIERYSIALSNENRYLDPPEFTVSHEKGLIYLVNSKVACSSIKASMLDDEVPDDYTVHRAIFMQGMTRRELTEEEQNYFKFTFVRNPFARLVSCYESKYHTDLERYKKRFDFRDYLNGYLYKDEGFDEFVRKVCALPYRLMDRHFRSQYDLIYNAAGTQFNYIGHFESLEEEFSTIQNKYRLRPLPHLNRVGTDDWMNYYTSETADLVYKTFRDDIETFGYEKCYSDLLAFIQNQKN